MNQKVAVIGTGRMGSALASALSKKGFATMVWNRTAARAEPLAKLGLHVAPNILEAVKDADIIVINISNYDSIKQLLRHTEVESALRGKIIVQLTTGTPDEAREMESWAKLHAIEYLDGAISGNPTDVGRPRSCFSIQAPKNFSIASSRSCSPSATTPCSLERNRPRFGARYGCPRLRSGRDVQLSPGIRRL